MLARFPRLLYLTFFLLALGVRAAALLLRQEYLPPPRQIVGAEAGVVARHLVAGHGFASPFDTSPTSPPSTHLPPVYPLLLAAGMKLGLGHDGLFYAAILLNLLASAFLPLIALRIGDAAEFPKPVSIAGAIALCFCPEALRAVGLVWDEALFVTCAALVLWWMLARLAQIRTRSVSEGPDQGSNGHNGASLRHASVLGIFNGALALLNPSMVLAIPFAWLMGLHAKGVAWRKLASHAVLVGALTLVASSPWNIRNWLLLDPPATVFVRGNFWLEVWSSLNPVQRVELGNGKVEMRPLHPWNGTESLVRTDMFPPVQISEQEYFDWCRERSIAAFRGNPRLLITHVARQFNAFWFGIAEAQRWYRSTRLFFFAQGVPAIFGILGLYAARKRMSAMAQSVFGALLIAYPLPYYLAGGAARYRHPIDLVLYLGSLILCIIWGWEEKEADSTV